MTKKNLKTLRSVGPSGLPRAASEKCLISLFRFLLQDLLSKLFEFLRQKWKSKML